MEKQEGGLYIEEIAKKVKVAILGDSKIGKTELISKLLDTGLSVNSRTIEQSYNLIETINNKKINLNIVDTSGGEEHFNLVQLWISDVDGIVLAFSINNKKSFDNLKKYYNKIRNLKGRNFPMVLIGLQKNSNENREVSIETGKTQAMMWSISYYELSENNLKAPFKSLVNKILLKEENGKKFDPSAIVNNCKATSCFCTIF